MLFNTITIISTLTILVPASYGAASWNLTRLQPSHVHIAEKSNATMMCTATTPLSKCHFMVQHFRDAGPQMDMSHGHNAGQISFKRGRRGPVLYTARYAGDGLQAGHCGLDLTHVAWGQYVVGCRVQAMTGGWARQEMVLWSDTSKPFDVSIYPLIATVIASASITILCRSEKPFVSCVFNLPSSQTVDLSKGKDSDTNGQYLYHGTGLNSGECGITIVNANESHTGRVWCRVQTSNYEVERRSTMLSVITPQLIVSTSVELIVNRTHYTEGDELKATCRVQQPSCVPFEITWLIGSDKIRKDNIKDSDPWGLSWNGLDFTQQLTKKLTWRDNGYDLKCHVSYLAQTNPIVRNVTLFVKFKDAADTSGHANQHLINHELCGYVPINYNVAHGSEAGLFQYPWMALLVLQYPGEDYKQYICGASVINKKYILTAAHCLESDNIPYITVRVGEHDTNTTIDCRTTHGRSICMDPPQNLRISQVIIHPQFHITDNINNDIALIRVVGDMDFQPESVRPICLPVGHIEQLRQFTGKTLMLAGWGMTHKSQQSTTLQVVEVAAVSLTKCMQKYKRTRLPSNKKVNINNDMMCAGGGSSHVNQCRGDSGGPLVTTGLNEDKYTQYGIVSFGETKCGTGSRPGVYTRVGHFMPWILDNIEP